MADRAVSATAVINMDVIVLFSELVYYSH